MAKKSYKKLMVTLFVSFLSVCFVCLKAGVSFVTVTIITITKSNEFDFSFIRVKII